MSTYRQLVYLILDELKLLSDDSTYNEEHVIFLLNKYRGSILNQVYSNIKKEVPDSNYQSICVTLEEVPAMSGVPCEGDSLYLKSTSKIPYTLNIGNTRLFPKEMDSNELLPTSFYKSQITYVSRERMKYVGHNKYLKNFIYASTGPDSYLYLTSSNDDFKRLKKVSINAIFENPEDVLYLQCNSEVCDILDLEFPLEEALVPMVVQSVMKELLGAAWRPADTENNAADDLSKIANFIARNMKSQYQRQLDVDPES